MPHLSLIHISPDPVLKESALLTNIFNRIARSCFYTAQKHCDGRLPLGGPVSYTHLDVYKRQPHVSPGQTLSDVGINVTEDGSLVGDVAFDEVVAVVEAVTPVPRGVGSVTTSVLCKHVAQAAERMLV